MQEHDQQELVDRVIASHIRLFAVAIRQAVLSMVIEVKGGRHVTISMVRDLRGVLERETAQLAGLIVLEPPSDRQRANFLREMAQAGTWRCMVSRIPGCSY